MDLTFRVTTQVVLDCEATCVPSVCGIYFNTNHTNLTNCAGVPPTRKQFDSCFFNTPTWRLYPARLVRLERFVLKETRIELPPTRFGPYKGRNKSEVGNSKCFCGFSKCFCGFSKCFCGARNDDVENFLRPKI